MFFNIAGFRPPAELKAELVGILIRIAHFMDEPTRNESGPAALPQPMDVAIERNADYVQVTLTGPQVHIPQLMDLIRKIGAATRDHGDRCLLLDMQRVVGEVHVAGQMQVGQQIVRYLAHLAAVASVVPTERITRASETVARMQGVHMKVFDDQQAAIIWLRATARDAEPAPEKAKPPLDVARAAIWDAVRHLFPPQAQAIQLPSGTLAISWPLSHRDTDANQFEMATPITVRLEQDLVDRLRLATGEHRKRIAAHQEAAFREGLIGYDPYMAVPKSRVIVLG